jgi:hypothetical protein
MGLVSAQKPGFTRVALQSHELSVPGRMGVQAVPSLTQYFCLDAIPILVKSWAMC